MLRLLPMDSLSNAISRCHFADVQYLVEKEKMPITPQHIKFAEAKRRELSPPIKGSLGPASYPIDAIITYLSQRLLPRSKL